MGKAKEWSLNFCVLSLLFLNVQGLSGKLNVIESLTLEEHYDIICLSEHWLLEDELQSFSYFSGFSLVSFFRRQNFTRGGTLIYVSDKIDSRCLDVSAVCIDKHFEASAIIVDSYRLIIVSLYRTPDSDERTFLDNLESLLVLLNKWSSYQLILGGDLNSKFDITKDTKSVKEFLNLLRQFNMYCVNDKPTRNNACLDNVFTNSSRKDIFSEVLPFPYSDHNILKIRLCLEKTSQDPFTLELSPVEKRTFSACNIRTFKYFLTKVNWPNEFNSCVNSVYCKLSVTISNAEKYFNTFFETFMFYFNESFPLKKVRANSNAHMRNNKNKMWYDDNLRRLKENVILAYDLFKLNQTEVSKQNFQNLKYLYRKSINDAKIKFNEDLINKSHNKCKTAWSLINSVSKTNSTTVKHNIKPNTFNNYFVQSVRDIRSSITKTNVDPLKMLKNCNFSVVPFHWSLVTVSDVISVIKDLNGSKSRDFYDVSSSIVKEVSEGIVEPLAFCVNQCLYGGVFPEVLKIAKVSPIFKKGDRNNPSSYRPISLVPILGKIIESLVFKQVSSHLELHGLFSDSQFGFRRGRSTADAIDAMVTDILQAFEDRAYAWGTLCDLSRAFDCVDHVTLLQKLEHYGFRGAALNFFKSYLSNRWQLVGIGGERSTALKLECGVPQGSILGPLLFLIAINDLPGHVSACSSYLYADDSTFLVKGADIAVLQTDVNAISLKVSNWFSANSFLLNNDKTQNIVFSLRDIPDNIVSNQHVKLLGMILDRSLSWTPHIEQVCTRLSRVIFLLRRLMDCVPHASVRSAYFAFFHSIMRYGLIFYGNSSGINSVLLLQKKAVRILAKADYLDHCRPLFIKLRVLTVINLYIFELLLKTKHNIGSHIHRRHIHSISTRNNNLLDIPFVRLSKTKTSHLIVGLKLFNKLPLEVKELGFTCFKQKIFNWLVQNPFYDIDEFLDSDCIFICDRL